MTQHIWLFFFAVICGCLTGSRLLTYDKVDVFDSYSNVVAWEECVYYSHAGLYCEAWDELFHWSLDGSSEFLRRSQCQHLC